MRVSLVVLLGCLLLLPSGPLVAADEPLKDWSSIGPFASHTEARSRLLRAYGGSEESERSVAMGLDWLARQQRPNGNWVFDGERKDDTIGATAFALLPFLGAGNTHKSRFKFDQTVLRGLQFLILQQRQNGGFNCPMDSQGMAALALCEALTLSEDEKLLLEPARRSIDYLVSKQNRDGGWGEKPDDPSTTTALAWPSQAMRAAVLGRKVKVPDESVQKITAYLDSVASGSRKAVYGERKSDGKPGTTTTAIGILARCDSGKWTGADVPVIVAVEGLMTKRPKQAPERPDVHFAYFATRIIALAYAGDGSDWKDWNQGPLINGRRSGGMRDWIVSLQEKKDGANRGSWESDGVVVGKTMGRLGTTAYSILTLEVYYRYLGSPAKSDPLKEPEKKK